MKKLLGIQEIFLSLLLLFDVWTDKTEQSNGLFFKSLCSNPDEYLDSVIHLTVGLTPPLKEQDDLFASEWYLLDEKPILSKEELHEFRHRMYRLLGEAEYKGKNLVICETHKKELICFEKEVFAQFFNRINYK